MFRRRCSSNIVRKEKPRNNETGKSLFPRPNWGAYKKESKKKEKKTLFAVRIEQPGANSDRKIKHEHRTNCDSSGFLQRAARSQDWIKKEEEENFVT